jgi:hypothetical protein
VCLIVQATAVPFFVAKPNAPVHAQVAVPRDEFHVYDADAPVFVVSPVQPADVSHD